VSGPGLSTVEDVIAAVTRDERLGPWSVRRHGDGFVELEVTRLTRVRGSVIAVMVWPAIWRDRARLEPHLVRARSGNYGLLLVGSDEDFVAAHADKLADEADVAAIAVPTSHARMALALRARAEASTLRMIAAALEAELEQARHENQLLIAIGRALSQQRDTPSLLEIILRRAREVTGADAGSVYIVEGLDEEPDKRSVRFMITQNDSRPIESKGFTMPVAATSIVGSCVLSSDVINIPDLYHLDAPGTGNNPWGFHHDRSFDDRHRYQTRSMLTVPMISARNLVIGVIQLINKRAKGFATLDEPGDFDVGVVPFDEVAQSYAGALASQAGIALENAMLYEEVKTLFDGFVRAAVTAIESRDPTTSGHSERVAELTVGLAKATDRLDSGKFAGLTFGADELIQLEYAALLHDFGKVGVREHVLVKAKKLHEHQREIITQRFAFIRRGLEVEGLTRKLDYLVEKSRAQAAAELESVDRELGAKLAELDEFLKFIMTANEPTVLEQGGFERIAVIAARRYIGGDGRDQPYLSDDEARALQILRGSLTDTERDEMNSHVVHTYNFLKQIPWGRAFRQVPEIAGSHHEKLDGSGYPNGLEGDQIPVPARMMTISDIYDALTASDRPYKKAIPTEKALDILSAEVKRGFLDRELFEIFLGAKVYLVTAPQPQGRRRRWSTSPLRVR
jgi:HD-GYP domain-containing protein (c-di-GMP phosphodiesterase class II)